MVNPKTTIAGYIGLLGTFLATVGQAVPGKWGTGLTTTGLILTGGAASIGNVSSQDGSH